MVDLRLSIDQSRERERADHGKGRRHEGTESAATEPLSDETTKARIGRLLFIYSNNAPGARSENGV